MGSPASTDPRASGTDLSRAFKEDGQRKTHVGGQALIEGIMMRGKYNWAVAVREPDGGIYVEEHDLVSGKEKHSWMKLPFIRGCTALVESLGLGFKALEIAAEHAFGDRHGFGGESMRVKSISSKKPMRWSPDSRSSSIRSLTASLPGKRAPVKERGGSAKGS